MISTTRMPVALPRTPGGGRVTQAGVALSEWTKLRSLRSMRYALLATAALIIGLALTDAIVTVSQWSSMSAADQASFTPLGSSLLGVNIAVLVTGMLGVLLFTSEFATGSVSSTFAAVPRRLPVLWGKSGVYTLVALAVTVPATLIAFFAGQAVLSTNNLQIGFTAGGVARAVFGAALYMTIAGLLGLGIGVIVRSTAAAIGTLTGILFVLPGLVGLLPASVSNAITPYLPSNAGQAIMNITPQAHALSPWVGLALFAAYTAATLTAAAVLLVRRDA
jgi:hypothetical protein